MSFRLGIDTGGTFTDFIRLGPDGLTVHKLRSTPGDPSQAILAGIADLTAAVARLDVIHGSTVATNAVLERKGARVALVATQGFEDVLRIGRQTRSELYNIFVPLPRPLLDSALTFGISERLDARGRVLTPVDVDAVMALVDRLREQADVVALCFLHSYANPGHERQVAGLLRDGGLRVCTSHEVLPEYREFERWSTTVVNAYVTPLIDKYLSRLESSLIGARGAPPPRAGAPALEDSLSSRRPQAPIGARGAPPPRAGAPALEDSLSRRPQAPIGARGAPPPRAGAPALEDSLSSRRPQALVGARGAPPLRAAAGALRSGPLPRHSNRLSIMQSNGGTISSAAARAQAVRTVLSGPAAGVVGARAVAAAAGISRLISFDMGGTSTDVSLIDGAVQTTRESRVGDFPVSLPMLDIHTVGAGGGSIAAIDRGGALRVGPRSAGAVPGPVCYGTGTELTVTDANLLLGRLDPHSFLDGRMAVETTRVREIAASMARPLKLTVEQLAEGIVRVANANMERAIRLVSVERGHDPREFVLLAFGGAGGMHACALAERLEMPSVLVPRHAGVLSALGMLMADVTKDYSASVLRQSGDLSMAELERRTAPLVAEARRTLTREGFRGKALEIRRLLDVRYAGQSYEITVPLAPDYRAAFNRTHARLYGYSNPSRPTEVVNVRVVARGETRKPDLPFERVKRVSRPQPSEARRGRFSGRSVDVKLYRWDALSPGAAAPGPAVITGGEATVVVPPGLAFKIDGFGNVVVPVSAARGRR